MMKRFVKENNILIGKRLTAILVAVVFVLGMMYVPAEIYAVETDAAGDAVVTDTTGASEEAAASQAEPADAGEEGTVPETNAETVVEETSGEENEEPTVESADEASTEAVVEELTDVLTVDLDNIDENEYDGFIYKLADEVTKKEVKEMESAIDDLDESEGQEVEEVIEKEVYVADSIETIAEVVSPEQVEYIEPDYIVHAMEVEPNDPAYKEHGWYLKMINAPYVWDKRMFGEGVKIAVLDSGVKTSHVEFADTTFVAKYNATRFGNAQDIAHDITDNSGHGTAVTGIIAAAQNNGKGLTGIMPDSEIIAVKVMEYDAQNEQTIGSVSDVVEGIDYAIEKEADVINISAGVKSSDRLLEEACQRAAAKGVIVVAAVGNDYSSIPEYPAAYDTVIGVGSIERDGTHSDFSNYNRYVAVSAPGRGIRTPYLNGGYATYVGTSFSAPQVSAMAAMIKQIDPDINYESFISVIAGSSEDKGTTGYDAYYGYGLMNLKNAYRHLTENDISVYDVSLSVTSLAYDGKVKTPTVTVKQAGKPLSADHYKTTYDAGRTAIGTYNVKVEGINGYTGSKIVSFRINPLGDVSKCTVSLASKSYTYDGKVKTPSVVVSNAGKAVSSGYYKTAYTSGRTAIGTYKVTVSGVGGYIGSKVLSFNIIPPLVKGINAPKRGKGKLTVRWKAMSKKQKKTTYKNVITGYQVRVSTSSRFANAKYASVKGIAKTSATVKGLKRKTYYYVQYRSYKTVGSTTYYSKWSSKKKTRTR